MLYTCPCCGYKTLPENPPGTDEICKICFWEDDLIQSNDPDFEGGANKVSLRQAQKNYMKIGASDEAALKFIQKLTPNIEKDLNWKPLS